VIEVIHPSGESVLRATITFDEISQIVGGYVQLVTVLEDGKETQCCCDEDGLHKGLLPNFRVTNRFRGKINMGPAALGTWVILTGKDLLQ